ncbi:MAG: hypothetical protein F7C32_01735 [Desulfurococcales archaeon]|nr:hypothetical protein [Desulfurococcales archaeon]
MEIEYILRIKVGDKKECIGLATSLEPDNLGLPENLDIKVTCEDEFLRIKVTCKNCHVLSMKNTILDILLNLKVAMEAIKILNK